MKQNDKIIFVDAVDPIEEERPRTTMADAAKAELFKQETAKEENKLVLSKDSGWFSR